MTKKDYIILAQALRREIGGGYLQIVDSIADALSRDNEKFDRVKFFDVCGVLPPHEIKIISLHDAQAECQGCGWHYAATGERTRAEIVAEFNKSHNIKN